MAEHVQLRMMEIMIGALVMLTLYVMCECITRRVSIQTDERVFEPGEQIEEQVQVLQN